MKKVLITTALLLTTGMSFAQRIVGEPPSEKVGFNMPNAAETITTASDSTFFIELLPAGGLFQWRDRYDKHNENPEDIARLFRYLQKNQRGFDITFVGTDSIGFDNAAAISTLQKNGIQVPVAEFVNEAFYKAGGYSFNWAKYEPELIKFIADLKAVDPNIAIGLPVAPKPLSVFPKEKGGSGAHDTWNNALFNFINTHPETKFCKIIHLYYTGAFVAELGPVTTDETGAADKIKAPTKRTYSAQTDTLDETYWKNIFFQSHAADFFEPMLEYLDSHAPQATTRITETGYIGASKLNGSWVVAAKAFELACLYGNDSRHDGIFWHGGFTASRVGAAGPRSAEDVRDADNPNNVTTPTWDAFALYFSAGGGIYPFAPQIHIDKPGTFSYWFLNGAGAIKPSITTSDNLKVSYVVRFIKAERFSSIGTTMEFTRKGSTISPTAVSDITNGDEIPALSFGFVEVTVTEKKIGCTDPTAENYDPEAEISGTCTYPEICYKKRWLFSGCKPDPKCKTNNCTTTQAKSAF